MIVTLDEMKQYLRVDYLDDDALIEDLITTSESLCMDILRTDDPAVLAESGKGKLAVMYAIAFLYEHREEADHRTLNLCLRALLEGDRKAGF
ncbi:MAG: head-tail connector protein [Eubacteriales bacterium]|nr:head-tail connector protein [Eubacteriales bacterium]